ncbi:MULTISPECIES: CopD family protein [Bordetella]|uniref:CopD family protein n=1 Tax=Bordetella TaxID=517 RepID=UPI000459DFE7|nr:MULTISPECIES: CopD family protein [Bordetella]KCV66152.1 PF03653 family protein [Bordetella bronchiseptica 99-R-0433]
MLYSWIKILHVVAVAGWTLGLLVLSSVTAFPVRPGQAPGRFAQGLARCNRWLIAPAMAVGVGCGFYLASMAGWFGQPWLGVKLALVGLLAVLHGAQSLVLRRQLASPAAGAPAWLAAGGAVVFFASAAIVLLAVVKPSF